jgi:hypothetical protein
MEHGERRLIFRIRPDGTRVFFPPLGGASFIQDNPKSAAAGEYNRGFA